MQTFPYLRVFRIFFARELVHNRALDVRIASFRKYQRTGSRDNFRILFGWFRPLRQLYRGIPMCLMTRL